MANLDNSSGHFGSLLGDGRGAAGLRKRRRAEWRLKSYGIAAIAVAGFALFSLLGSVIIQASGALTEAYVTIPVELVEDEIDPEGNRDAKKILRADFAGITKDTLKAAFPAVTGRSAKRELYDVVSTGGSFELAEIVSENPDLVGTTYNHRYLASDVTDLYLKGSFGRLNEIETEGLLSLTGDDKEVEITSTSDDFAKVLVEVKALLLDDAKRLRRHAARQNNAVSVYTARVENAVDDEVRAAEQKKLDRAIRKRDKLLKDAESVEARAGASVGAEEIDDENRSVLLRANGGWLKVTEIDVNTATATVLKPFETPVENAQDWTLYMSDLPEAARKVSDTQIMVIEELREAGAIDQVFNWRFFSSGDSREPELAGIWGATVGSFWTMLVTFLLAFPIGVSAAIYLEEFAPKNKFTDFIEVNIIVEIPTGITDSASVLPVQVFRWSDFPERAFEAKTGAAICVLLVFLVIMNAIAILLRRRFERRW